MGKAKEEDIPNPNQGFLYYLMDRHMWIFTIFLVPISLIYDVYFKLYTLFNLWKDSQKVSESNIAFYWHSFILGRIGFLQRNAKNFVKIHKHAVKSL